MSSSNSHHSANGSLTLLSRLNNAVYHEHQSVHELKDDLRLDYNGEDMETYRSDRISDELSTHRPLTTDRTIRDEDVELYDTDTAPFEDDYASSREDVSYTEEYISDNLLWKKLLESIQQNGLDVSVVAEQLEKQPSVPYATSQALRSLLYEMITGMKEREADVQHLTIQNEALSNELAQSKNYVKQLQNREKSFNLRSNARSLTDTEDNMEVSGVKSRRRYGSGGIPENLKQVKTILGNLGQLSADRSRSISSVNDRKRSGSLTVSSRSSLNDALCTRCSLRQKSPATSDNETYFKELLTVLNLKEDSQVVSTVKILVDKAKVADISQQAFRKLSVLCKNGFFEKFDSEKGIQHVVTGINEHVEYCNSQLNELKRLRRALRKLGSVITSGRLVLHHSEDILSMVSFVETLCNEAHSYSLLCNIADHLQSLFDVRDINKLFPVINVFYQDFQELQQVLKNLRQALHLSDAESSLKIQAAVQKLCSLQQEKVSSQLRQVLRVNDLQPVLDKLRDYDEFIPVFRNLIHQLFDLLGVRSINQILPAVKRCMRNCSREKVAFS